jgi:FkbM family methyltransferase
MRHQLNRFLTVFKTRKNIGFYRSLAYRSLPKIFLARILIVYFRIFRRFLRHVVIPLGFRKRIIIPSKKDVKDFDEVLGYVYFGSMYELMKIKLHENSVCIDVGAHYGFYSLKMSSRCKIVISLEPVPENFAVLYNSLMSSGIKNVIPYPLAAGDVTGSLLIKKPQGGTDEMYTLREDIVNVRETYPVKVVSLDLLLDHLSIQEVDLVKIDVEGFEERVLKGLRNRLSKKLINTIILEIHSPLLLDKCIRMLREAYDIKVFRISKGLYLAYAIKKS